MAGFSFYNFVFFWIVAGLTILHICEEIIMYEVILLPLIEIA